jgi:predicted CDP-diglyceride synthetase/phosphatidate cytidylyltransferase
MHLPSTTTLGSEVITLLGFVGVVLSTFLIGLIFAGLGEFDVQSATVQIFVVHGLNGLLGLVFIDKVNETVTEGSTTTSDDLGVGAIFKFVVINT